MYQNPTKKITKWIYWPMNIKVYFLSLFLTRKIHELKIWSEYWLIWFHINKMPDILTNQDEHTCLITAFNIVELALAFVFTSNCCAKVFKNNLNLFWACEPILSHYLEYNNYLLWSLCCIPYCKLKRRFNIYRCFHIGSDHTLNNFRSETWTSVKNGACEGPGTNILTEWGLRILLILRIFWL